MSLLVKSKTGKFFQGLSIFVGHIHRHTNNELVKTWTFRQRLNETQRLPLHRTEHIWKPTVSLIFNWMKIFGPVIFKSIARDQWIRFTTYNYQRYKYHQYCKRAFPSLCFICTVQLFCLEETMGLFQIAVSLGSHFILH